MEEQIQGKCSSEEEFSKETTIVRKDKQELTLIDITVPADQKIIITEEEKVDRYQDLAFEIKGIHRALKMTVIPVIG